MSVANILLLVVQKFKMLSVTNLASSLKTYLDRQSQCYSISVTYYFSENIFRQTVTCYSISVIYFSENIFRQISWWLQCYVCNRFLLTYSAMSETNFSTSIYQTWFCKLRKKTENNFEKTIDSQNESYTSLCEVLYGWWSWGNGAKSCILATSWH